MSLGIRIGTLAVTGITIVAAALLTLSTTAASAATTTTSAPGHATAPSAAEASGCVTETFTIADEPYYEACVADAQILFNDLQTVWATYGINQGVTVRLTVDGSYGPATQGVVSSFQAFWGLSRDGKLGPMTWAQLCEITWLQGYHGTYWHDAGCTVPT
jgi:peptidoglycan hydrolase-like protein with peptidoglycan-binding domain